MKYEFKIITTCSEWIDCWQLLLPNPVFRVPALHDQLHSLLMYKASLSQGFLKQTHFTPSGTWKIILEPLVLTMNKGKRQYKFLELD